MKHPDPNKIRKVFQALEAMVKDMTASGIKCNLDMGVGNVMHIGEKIDRHMCGTYTCHGGWLALLFANNPQFGGTGVEIIGGSYRSKTEKSPRLDYSVGADKLAQYLGFDSREDLEFWAMDNGALWGNQFGQRMFSMTSLAFNGPRGGRPPETIRTVCQHWYKVAGRIEKANRKLNEVKG